LRLLKKILFYTIGLVVVILISTGLFIYFYKDKIIQQFITEANKSLNTPVKVGKIEISVWESFPDLSIDIYDIYVEDSSPRDNALFTAKKLSFVINPIEAWNGNYSIRGLQIETSKINPVIDINGQNNFAVFKEQSANSRTIALQLENISLFATEINYDNEEIHQHYSINSKKSITSIGFADNIYTVATKGDIHSNQFNIDKRIFFENKELSVVLDFSLDNTKKNIDINSSSIAIGKSIFEVKGDYSFKSKNIINISATGKNTNIQTLLSFVPQALSKQFAQYQSKGEVYFITTIKGEVSKSKSPLFIISFGCNKASFSHPSYKSKIEHATIEGSFASSSLTDFSHAELFIKNISGELNGKNFEGNFSLQDFKDPSVTGNFKGELDAASIESFYPIKNIKNIGGLLKANVSFEGKLSLLKSKSTAQKVKADGTIEMHNIHFTEEERNVSFEDLNGSLQFNNNDLALSNVSGKLGKSDFLMNGFLKNVMTFLLFENQPIGIEADLSSHYLDLDNLFKIGFGEIGSADFGFSISPLLHLNFNCDIKSLSYKNFKPREIKGNLLIRNQKAISRNTRLKALGGDINLNGIVDAKNSKSIDITGIFNVKGIHVDSAFYVFDNFYQSFIEGRHLKGEAFADVTLEATVNEKLALKPETLIADINATLKNGELNNFEPLQKLNKYLDDEGLSKLRFGELKNEIHVENKTIFIPQMEIKSNLSIFQLSGTHTFDQHIDYHIIAPLRNKKKIDKDEAFGAVEEDGTGKTKVFIKITGTTDNYVISLDKQALKKKIISDLKKEIKELKDAFKTKGQQKKKEIELQKDEYFDWRD
jgi:hypothetical protein